MSILLSRIKTMSPRRLEVTSCRLRSRSSASISSTINSTCSSVTCCLAHALAIPARNFSLSNGSFPPSRLITMSLNGSRLSYVVNLFPHARERHSRRRLTASLVSESRESMTFVSSKSQYGHCISKPLSLQHHIWYCENLAHYIFEMQYPRNTPQLQVKLTLNSRMPVRRRNTPEMPGPKNFSKIFSHRPIYG